MLLTVEEFVDVFGEEECLKIAGTGPRDFPVLERPRIEEAIAHASAIVVGYVRDRWPSAVQGTPLLKGFAADIARWRLRGRGGQQAAMVEVVQKRYDEALVRLRDIASGKLTLDVEPSSASGADTSDASNELAVHASITPSRIPTLLDGFRP